MTADLKARVCIDCGFPTQKAAHAKRCQPCKRKFQNTRIAAWKRRNPERTSEYVAAANARRSLKGCRVCGSPEKNGRKIYCDVCFTAKRRRTKRDDKAIYKGRLRKAKPKWANQFFIREAYRLARLRTEVTGIPWHVDHEIPIRGINVCGLHVETNLRVIPGILNMRKTNRFSPDGKRA